ncbi:MAG: NAD-dependent epimerase/dehydratase family protein [Saprospiraceae bacterium]|nr:NAD-dependent epimerase/dehydratase family protein [Candidatus Opimibacter skivensis]
MNVLITGGAGFIGSSLAERLAQHADNYVVVLDNLLSGYVANVPQTRNIRFIKGDANDYNTLAAIMHRYQFDYVFHYAALVGVQRTLSRPKDVLQDIKGIENILELSKNSGVIRVFYSSSSEVYGEPVVLPQHEETTPLNSRLPYAVVKNVGECYFRSYQQEHGLDYTIFRFFNTYGPKQSTDFVISKFLEAAMADRDITLYGDGLQTRTFCYITDNLDFTESVLKDKLFINDVVNVGNDVQYTIRNLAELVVKVTASASAITYLPALPEGDMTRRQPDTQKMKSVLNREYISLEQGLQEILTGITFK